MFDIKMLSYPHNRLFNSREALGIDLNYVRAMNIMDGIFGNCRLIRDYLII